MHGKNLTTWAYSAKNGVKQKNDGVFMTKAFGEANLEMPRTGTTTYSEYHVQNLSIDSFNRHRQENQGLAAFHKDMSMKFNALFYAMIYLHVSYSYK